MEANKSQGVPLFNGNGHGVNYNNQESTSPSISPMKPTFIGQRRCPISSPSPTPSPLSRNYEQSLTGATILPHATTNGTDTNLLQLIKQQADEIRKLRKDLLNITNERDALLCEVHHLKMDILASELGRLGSQSSPNSSMNEGNNNSGEFDDETAFKVDSSDEEEEGQGSGSGEGLDGEGTPREKASPEDKNSTLKKKKTSLSVIDNSKPNYYYINYKCDSDSQPNRIKKNIQINAMHSSVYYNHMNGTSVDEEGNTSIYSSSEMTRLSTSSSSSSASSSPVLFTSSQSSSSQFHDSTEETGESGLVERRYGGQPARKAALVIQRAFRRYSMVKEFQRIKAERRLSRRINNNVPTTGNVTAATTTSSTATVVVPGNTSTTTITSNGTVPVVVTGGQQNGCEICVDCHLSSSSDEHLPHSSEHVDSDPICHHSHHHHHDGIVIGVDDDDEDEEESSIHSGELSRSPCPDVTEIEIGIDHHHLPHHLRSDNTSAAVPPVHHQHYSNHHHNHHLHHQPSSTSPISSAPSLQSQANLQQQQRPSPSSAGRIVQSSASSRSIQYEPCYNNGSGPVHHNHNAQYEPCSRYIPQQQQQTPRPYIDYQQYQHPYRQHNGTPPQHHHLPHQMSFSYGQQQQQPHHPQHQLHHCNSVSGSSLSTQPKPMLQMAPKVTISPNNNQQQQQSIVNINNGVIRNNQQQVLTTSNQQQQQPQQPAQQLNNSNNTCRLVPMTDIECEILRKRLYRVGLNLFNKKPEVGISYLVKKKFIEGTAGAVSRFLISRKGLSKQMVGEYLANLQNPFCQSCLENFSNEIDLTKMPIDLALRRFQTYLRMPGEAQKIERVMETFSQRYAVCNPQITGQFRNGADTVFVLAFAIIMLNTDLHTPHLKADRRMKMEDFIKNLRGIDDGADLPREMLVEIYERIKQSEFRTGSDHVSQVMKVQQTIVGKKPNLALPHRRLVCYCRLYEVADVNKREKVGSHQREVFLFNDILVLTKIFHKKRNSVTYSYRQSYPLIGITLVLYTNQHFEYGLSLRKGETVLLNLNARNEHDRAKFAEDLREAIAESDEMGRMESLPKENRDSGVDVGKIKRFSNSLLDINDQCKPTRRGSCGSLDSGMSISFHSDENQQLSSQQSSQQNSSSSNNNSSRSSSSICHKHQNSSCSNSSTSTTQSK